MNSILKKKTVSLKTADRASVWGGGGCARLGGKCVEYLLCLGDLFQVTKHDRF